MHELAPALLAVLHSTSISEDPVLRKTIVSAVCDPDFMFVPLLLRVVDSSATMTIDELERLGIVTLARHCATSLEAELARPERSPQDWSITVFTSADGCQACTERAAHTRSARDPPVTPPNRHTTAGRMFLDLRRLAQTTGRTTDELLQLYALEGFLDRLTQSDQRDHFVLKGGVLRRLRNPPSNTRRRLRRKTNRQRHRNHARCRPDHPRR